MAIRDILRMGNPLLLRPSAPVDDPTAPGIRDLVKDMRDTLESVSGIGLAAPQIGVPVRVVLYCLPENRIPPGAGTRPIPWTAMINPVVEPLGNESVGLWERCLSLPGLYARVPRFSRIAIHYRTLDGASVTERWTGYVAALLQHECDHLDGVLYPMRMKDATALAYASEVCGEGAVYQYAAADFDGAPTSA
ncbi:peptide deformylase [Azospirillum rugosum]|uniref:Peptide deformylase n=1 Tax=Azospirillum rugosum TaxID=416170 RepID=A0ABS4SW54_9PROT|nr:peptide deformylase [Azospirillum rugosum]MBP2296788.1 peptide deformylase [Azospirillum rugosum]MDQ0530391.1 peptide deformylase [Azospirillum rugosum]